MLLATLRCWLIPVGKCVPLAYPSTCEGSPWKGHPMPHHICVGRGQVGVIHCRTLILESRGYLTPHLHAGTCCVMHGGSRGAAQTTMLQAAATHLLCYLLHQCYPHAPLLAVLPTPQPVVKARSDLVMDVQPHTSSKHLPNSQSTLQCSQEAVQCQSVHARVVRLGLTRPLGKRRQRECCFSHTRVLLPIHARMLRA